MADRDNEIPPHVLVLSDKGRTTGVIDLREVVYAVMEKNGELSLVFKGSSVKHVWAGSAENSQVMLDNYRDYLLSQEE